MEEFVFIISVEGGDSNTEKHFFIGLRDSILYDKCQNIKFSAIQHQNKENNSNLRSKIDNNLFPIIEEIKENLKNEKNEEQEFKLIIYFVHDGDDISASNSIENTKEQIIKYINNQDIILKKSESFYDENGTLDKYIKKIFHCFEADREEIDNFFKNNNHKKGSNRRLFVSILKICKSNVESALQPFLKKIEEIDSKYAKLIKKLDEFNQS